MAGETVLEVSLSMFFYFMEPVLGQVSSYQRLQTKIYITR